MGAVSIPAPIPEGDPAERARLPLATQLFRFVVTGGVSAIVDFGLLVVGMWLGLGPALSKAISWVFGTLTAYAINSRWTFQSAGSGGRLAAVATLYILTFALQVGTFAALVPPLEADFGTTIAQVVGFLIAQGLATLVNFVVQRVWIFA